MGRSQQSAKEDGKNQWDVKGVHRSKEKGKHGLQDVSSHVLSKHVGTKQAENVDSKIKKIDTTK